MKSHRTQRKKKRRALATRRRYVANPGCVGQAYFHRYPMSDTPVDVVDLQVTQTREATHNIFTGLVTITGTARLRFTRHYMMTQMPINVRPHMLDRFDLKCITRGQRILLRDCDVRRVTTVPTFDDSDLLDFDFSARYMTTMREDDGD